MMSPGASFTPRPRKATEIKEHERYQLLDMNHPDAARVALKARNRQVLWDRQDKNFIICIDDVYYGTKTLEGIERILDTVGKEAP